VKKVTLNIFNIKVKNMKLKEENKKRKCNSSIKLNKTY